MRGVLATLFVLGALGCDYGDPTMTEARHLVAIEDPGVLLIRWQAEGAIPEADVNGDGTVDITDLIIVSQNFGRHVLIGSLSILPDFAWRNEDEHPHGRIEVVNNGTVPVERMRLRYFVRDHGLLVDIDDGSLVTALIPIAGMGPTHIAPGKHGTGWLWSYATPWEDFLLGAFTIEVAVIRDADSFHAGQTP
jgi:hypothetical protein